MEALLESICGGGVSGGVLLVVSGHERLIRPHAMNVSKCPSFKQGLYCDCCSHKRCDGNYFYYDRISSVFSYLIVCLSLVLLRCSIVFVAESDKLSVNISIRSHLIYYILPTCITQRRTTIFKYFSQG